ncbi:MAG: sulfopyruvate decarboxylase subunit alpha [Methanotrichaceae archaeon]|nr:sulfopyruvate decarboxylase subunit alpha [Methanotrichaceae archaeon]MDD1758255.1 sulfopyruvate decarboxylase subunit alpha [Methanotrichaceae archaeon]
MIDPSVAVYRGLKRAAINFAASVPCINLGRLLEFISHDLDILHIPVTREEEGVGVCAGAWIGGCKPVLLMQNSGLGNSINALTSLDLLYGIPLLMIISHRGSNGESIIGQVPMGKLTSGLLKTMNISFHSPSPATAEESVVKAWIQAESQRRPIALLFDLEFWRLH